MVATHRDVDNKESRRGVAVSHISNGEALSALHPKADMCGYGWNVRFGPIADIAPKKKKDRLAAVSPSKDYLTISDRSNGLLECLLRRLIGAIERTASFRQCSHQCRP